MKSALDAERILSDKQRKNLSILELVVKRGPISRTEISRQTGLNIVTISNYVNWFIENHVVLEKGFDISTGGRRPTLVEFNPEFGYMIGLGLTAFNIIGILVDPRMQVVCEVKKARPGESSEVIIDKLVETVEEILSKAGVDTNKIKGIGIGIPGVIDEEGRTIRWLDGPLGMTMVSIAGVSLRDIFEKEFGIPTLVEHDATCGVFGERWLGFDSNIKDMIYMYTGVRCGLIVSGRICKGASGCTGELGILNPAEQNIEARRKESLHLGTWELDLGVSHCAQKALKEGLKSRIFELAGNDPAKINLELVIEASKGGDKLAAELLETAGRQLGKKIAFLVNLLNPEIVVIGGGIEQAGSVFLDPLNRTVHLWSHEENVRNLKIIPSRLGSSAVSMGAACLVLQRLLMNA